MTPFSDRADQKVGEARAGTCRSCGMRVYFIKQISGKVPPFDDELGQVSHFVTCKDADDWRGKTTGGRS